MLACSGELRSKLSDGAALSDCIIQFGWGRSNMAGQRDGRREGRKGWNTCVMRGIAYQVKLKGLEGMLRRVTVVYLRRQRERGRQTGRSCYSADLRCADPVKEGARAEPRSAVS